MNRRIEAYAIARIDSSIVNELKKELLTINELYLNERLNERSKRMVISICTDDEEELNNFINSIHRIAKDLNLEDCSIRISECIKIS